MRPEGGKSADVAAETLATSPEWFPVEIAGDGTITLLQLSEAAYAASFLDGRLLHCGLPERRCGIARAALVAGAMLPNANYIFHIGHVGSTLVSRLVGRHENLFSLREPSLLRTAVAEAEAGGLSLCHRVTIFSRTWPPGQRAVIEPTSYVSELAERILGLHERSTAAFMFSPLR